MLREPDGECIPMKRLFEKATTPPFLVANDLAASSYSRSRRFERFPGQNGISIGGSSVRIPFWTTCERMAKYLRQQ